MGIGEQNLRKIEQYNLKKVGEKVWAVNRRVRQDGEQGKNSKIKRRVKNEEEKKEWTNLRRKGRRKGSEKKLNIEEEEKLGKVWAVNRRVRQEMGSGEQTRFNIARFSFTSAANKNSKQI